MTGSIFVSCPSCQDEMARAVREISRQRAELDEWAKDNRPGGWIDNLRKRAGFDPVFAQRAAFNTQAGLQGPQWNATEYVLELPHVHKFRGPMGPSRYLKGATAEGVCECGAELVIPPAKGA